MKEGRNASDGVEIPEEKAGERTKKSTLTNILTAAFIIFLLILLGSAILRKFGG